VLNKPQTFPNPGYLGSSSHKKIFDHIPRSDENEQESSDSYFKHDEHVRFGVGVDDSSIAYGAKIIEDIHQCVQVLSCCKLVLAWNGQQINLALAGSIIGDCSTTIENLFDGFTGGSGEALRMSRDLFWNSCRPLRIESTSTFEEFCTSFCQGNARWETIGLCFTAVSRATIDMTCFDGLFNTEQQRLSIRKLATRFSDSCLDIALSLDCLNDLQLLLQYENFINHSFVDGDQSELPNYTIESV
jgi:hypothetical protein